MPDNYLNVNKMKQNIYFDFFFFQRWSFFAPPPKSNDRLYFIFFNSRKERIAEYEVLETLGKDKQRNAPFNEREQILDYLISNCINSVKDNLRDLQNIINYKTDYEGKQISDSERLNFELKEIERTSDFKSLINYAKLILHTKELMPENPLVQIIITEIEIPQFADRMTNKRIEKTILASELEKLEK
jgi:hypothetical protein